MKWKKIVMLAASAGLCISTMPVRVFADDNDSHDYSDTDYWTAVCTDTTNLSEENKTSCEAFVQYLSSQSESFADKLSEIADEQKAIAGNIDEYKTKISEYSEQVNTLNSQISDTQAEIDDLNAQIADLQKQADDLQDKVSDQIAKSQSTMRLTKVFDLLLGAKSFDELIKIANGLVDVTNYNNKTLNELTETTRKLNETKAQVDDAKADLQDQQESALAAQYQAQTIEKAYEEKASDLDEDYTEVKLNQSMLNTIVTNVSSAQIAAAQAAAEEAQREAEAAAEAKRQAEAAAEAKRQQELAAQQAAQQQQQTENSTASDSSTDTSSSSTSTAPDGSQYADSSEDTSADEAVQEAEEAYEQAEGTALGKSIAAYAYNFLGLPYVWGATGPNAYDCSGLTQTVYAHFGIYLPRTSYGQEACGTIIPVSEAEPGDLITWTGHCGIYIGNNQCINALNPSYGVVINNIYLITCSNMEIHRLW